MRLFSPPIVLPVALAVMGLVIYSAYQADLARLAEQRRYRLEQMDGELRALETRFLGLLAAREPAADVKALRESYLAATEPAARHAAFEQLTGAVHRSLSTAAASSDAAARRFADETDGIANRWSAARESYRAVSAASSP